MAILAAALPRPAADGTLTITVEVWDEDGWLTGGDDELGTDTFILGSDIGFGANQVVHQRDLSNHRLTISIAGRARQVPEG